MTIDPARIVDVALEATVVPSFTRIGSAVRRRVDDWTPITDFDLTGRMILLTGGTSGLGRAAAEELARAGAEVIIVGRSAERNAAVVKELRAATGNDSVDSLAADMGELDDVRRLAREIMAHDDASEAALDTVIHNAGALSEQRSMTSDGIEATIAAQVIGPFLLNHLLLDRLDTNGPSRIITMSSGGMYTVPLSLRFLRKATDAQQPGYSGSVQYANAKRAQVTLNRMWPRRHPDRNIVFHAVHPGWADTPGVQESLPRFADIVGPLLRTPEEGADTLAWLAASPEALESTGTFWLDRRPRSTHRLPTTRKADTKTAMARLWDWATALAELDDLD